MKQEHTAENSWLEAWLTAATAGLCDAAVNRISEDVRGHYKTTVKDATDAGVPLEQAENDALMSLGNAEAAKRRFTRIHLTQAEQRLLAQRDVSLLFSFPVWLGIPVAAGLLLVLMAFLPMKMQKEFQNYWQILFWCCPAMVLSLEFAIQRLKTNKGVGGIRYAAMVAERFLAVLAKLSSLLLLVICGYHFFDRYRYPNSFSSADIDGRIRYLALSFISFSIALFHAYFAVISLRLFIKLIRWNPPIDIASMRMG